VHDVKTSRLFPQGYEMYTFSMISSRLPFSFLSTREAGGEDEGEGGLDDRRDIEDVVLSCNIPLTQLRVSLRFAPTNSSQPSPTLREGEEKSANTPSEV
jgi:hypothetical protein